MANGGADGGGRSESSRCLEPILEAGGRVPVRVGLVSNRHPHRMVRGRFRSGELQHEAVFLQ